MSLTWNKKVKAQLIGATLKVKFQSIYEANFDFDVENDEEACKEIKNIHFHSCLLMQFPSGYRLLNFAPNLAVLKISNSKISRIFPSDLRGLYKLIELDLSFNEIEELPEDLFAHAANLQRISFCHNKIKIIGEKILDPLKDLKFFDLGRNSGIDVCFHYTAGETSVYSTLAQFKEAIKRCKPVQHVWDIVDQQKEEIEEQKEEIATQKMKVDELEKKLELAEAFSKFDFTVNINGMEFKVQKKILVDNSPLLAKMIHDNDHIDGLELEDISEETFEEVLRFMVTKQPPKPPANFIELYASSKRLQMKELNDLCAQVLMEKVTKENALEILNLCKKYPNKELQKKAFDEMGKNLEE